MAEVDFPISWKQHLSEEFDKEYFNRLVELIREEKKQSVIYPPGKQIFNAFHKCGYENIKVVILGQDPYHGEGQANGLAFSVADGVPVPPSLVNIFKEVSKCTGKPVPLSGNLERWAGQGVLLLNAVLTVKAKQPGSHAKLGWELFTDAVIRLISDKKENIVFMLWGNYAQNKGQIIDETKHLVLKAPHPSPFSAYTGFVGCNHFEKANAYLKSKNISPIEW
jgi:uracil-DNA glycosylase